MIYELQKPQVEELPTIWEEQDFRLSDKVNCIYDPVVDDIQSRIDKATSKSTISTYRCILKKVKGFAVELNEHGASSDLL